MKNVIELYGICMITINLLIIIRLWSTLKQKNVVILHAVFDLLN